MSELSTLSVVIVTYCSSSIIAPCLQSIQKFNDIGDHLQVTVVDNSPTGDSTYGLICSQSQERWLWPGQQRGSTDVDR